MKFHKEGYVSLALAILFGVVVNLTFAHFFEGLTWLLYFGYFLTGFVFVVILQFFRSPKKSLTIEDGKIISPCDGKVVVIEEVEETEFIQEKRRQVSIFMSPINVHNNRYPIAGKISYYKYHPGKYLVAWHPKSSTENERTTVVVEDKQNRSVLFRQIAGALARRIVFYGKEGEEVKQSEECGFIKFGSRVDLLLPLDAKINVNLEEKVVGGVSVIASF